MKPLSKEKPLKETKIISRPIGELGVRQRIKKKFVQVNILMNISSDNNILYCFCLLIQFLGGASKYHNGNNEILHRGKVNLPGNTNP